MNSIYVCWGFISVQSSRLFIKYFLAYVASVGVPECEETSLGSRKAEKECSDFWHSVCLEHISPQ